MARGFRPWLGPEGDFMQVRTAAITAFLAAVPEGRRADMARVVDTVRRSVPRGYEAVVAGKCLVYQVPLAKYPDTYNKQPLWYVALASNATYMTLHLMPVYGDKALAKKLAVGFKAAGKKLDIGKACVHFRKADDLALDVVSDIVAAVPMARWIEIAESAKRRR